MNATKRPLSVWVFSILFVAVGSIGFVYHFPELLARHPDALAMEVTELVGLAAGIFMFLGRNWARWLALVWMAFHVAISFPELSKVAIHFLFLAAMVWLLFRPEARQYFQQKKA